MKRHAEQKLNGWKNNPERKPLVMRGARQVGKTYLLKQFGEREFSDVIYLNFELEKKYKDLFKDSFSPQKIVNDLELTFQRKIIPQSTLIIFDEIQDCPDAQTSLKYFCEQAPEYFVVAAGSLLGIKMKGSFPVGKVNFVDVYPLSFFEFVQALGFDMLTQAVSENRTLKPLPSPVHAQLNRLLREYLFIGGMPEAISNYLTHKDFEKVRVVQKEILNAYELDFAKHAPIAEVPRISALWHSIPSQLARENKKFKYSSVKSGARSKEFENALQWLCDANLIHLCRAVTKPGQPLKHYEEAGCFKIYLNDVGLLGAMNEVLSHLIIDESKLLVEYKGALAENFVAQQFLNSGLERLHYWTSQNVAEVDFVRAVHRHIVAFEVKAGVNLKSKSLKTFSDRYQPETVGRLNLLNFSRQKGIVNIPLYAAECVRNYFDSR